MNRIHYRLDWEINRPSLSGFLVFKVACRGWYISAACTDRPENATCKHCIQAIGYTKS